MTRMTRARSLPLSLALLTSLAACGHGGHDPGPVAAVQVAGLGLQLAGKRGLSHLGPLGLLARDEPDVRRGLQRIAVSMKLHSTCVVLQLQEEHGFAVVVLNVLPDGETLLGKTALVSELHRPVVARRGHPGFGSGGKLRARAWVEHPHVQVRTGSRSRSFVAEALQREGLERRVGLVVPTFLAALVAVAETDLFFAAPRELVQPLLPRLGLVVVAPPIAVPPVPIVALWHERYQADPAHRFFRTLVMEEVQARLRPARGRA